MIQWGGKVSLNLRELSFSSRPTVKFVIELYVKATIVTAAFSRFSNSRQYFRTQEDRKDDEV